MSPLENQIVNEFKELAKTPIVNRKCRLCEYKEFADTAPKHAEYISQRRFEELAKEAGYEFPEFCGKPESDLKNRIKDNAKGVIEFFKSTNVPPPGRAEAKSLTFATFVSVGYNDVTLDIVSTAVDEAAEEMRFTFAGETPLEPEPERNPQAERRQKSRDPLTSIVGNLLSADMQLAELRKLIADSLGKLDRIANKS